MDEMRRPVRGSLPLVWILAAVFAVDAVKIVIEPLPKAYTCAASEACRQWICNDQLKVSMAARRVDDEWRSSYSGHCRPFYALRMPGPCYSEGRFVTLKRMTPASLD
ncbi:hypothetical protein JYU34_013522 [Plutella xylostella]|uniref:Uncharacterized protein n=1 Tax=Plutella xylostella TaxID=51655 RepID=A0ABQ7QAA2_PLUXY|nr:hypothetical protein JYU34_013522 [Plutella xylostella]